MTMPTSPLPALIFGPHITALGVLRLLGRRGLPCYVVDETSNIIVRSRWYQRPERTLIESPDSAALDAYLRSSGFERAVLVACSDQWALAVSGLPQTTLQRFPASVPSHETIEQLVDKDRFRALVDRLDIPRPWTRLIRSLDDLAEADDDELEGGFLKPTESHRHNRQFGTKGTFIASRTQAEEAVRAAGAADITFLLQEWIPGGMQSTILLDGFVDREGTMRALIARRRLRMNPPRLGNTVAAVTVPLADVADAAGTLRQLFEAIGYRGVFNAEFKFDRRDGRFKIIEVNPRPAWFIGTLAGAGVDLPWMSYTDAQGLPVRGSNRYRLGRYAHYEVADAAAVLRAWRASRAPDGPLLRPWLVGDRALFWWRDPMPAVRDVSQIVGRRLGRSPAP